MPALELPPKRRLRGLAILSALALLAGQAACGECEKDFDCPGAKVCNTSEGKCETLTCREDQDCPPTQRCSANRCSATSPDEPGDETDAYLLQPAVSGPTDLGVFSPPD